MKLTTDKRIMWTLFFSSVILQLLGTLLINNVFINETKIYDPRFIQLAHNIVTQHQYVIHWGDNQQTDSIMLNPFVIQKGTYYNWFPIGYSLIISSSMLLSSNFKFVLFFMQLILFSFIPPLFYKVSKDYFNDRFPAYIPVIASLILMLNPYYLVSSSWYTDTWMICLLTLLNFRFIQILTNDSDSYVNILLFAFGVILLFFFRPLGVAVFLLVFILFFTKKLFFTKTVKFFIPLILLSVLTLIWGFRNKELSQIFALTHSNVGYNLWLGNNEKTNTYLKEYLGDGGTIEDKIIPYYNSKWSFLQFYSEYQKDDFFRTKAWNFVKSNPTITLSNVAWKIVGFWSPIRVRTGHWSESKLKTFLSMMFWTPLLLSSLLSVLIFFTRREYKSKYTKKLLLCFMFLWMLPHLFFFSTQRFRAPIDFGLILLTLDFWTPTLLRLLKKKLI